MRMCPATNRSRVRQLVGLAVAAAAIAACASIRPAAIIETFNHDATSNAVRQQVERFHDGFRRRDVDAVLSFFLADSDFRAYDGDEGWLTFNEMRLQDAVPFRRLKNVDLSVDSIHIAALDPSAAVVSSTLHEVFTDSAGHVERLRVTQTMVWTRRADGWKIAHIHSSERPDTTR
jgi:uncharacterized protein (TIGR02246 family)